MSKVKVRTEHTPGSWMALKADREIYIHGADGSRIASIDRHLLGDAALIVNAPEVLRELREATEALAALNAAITETGLAASESAERTVARCRALIAKAEGR